MNVESFKILKKRTCGQMSNRPRIIIRLIQITLCISATHGKFTVWLNKYLLKNMLIFLSFSPIRSGLWMRFISCDHLRCLVFRFNFNLNFFYVDFFRTFIRFIGCLSFIASLSSAKRYIYSMYANGIKVTN